jgi:hypothetical protein
MRERERKRETGVPQGEYWWPVFLSPKSAGDFIAEKKCFGNGDVSKS